MLDFSARSVLSLANVKERRTREDGWRKVTPSVQRVTDFVDIKNHCPYPELKDVPEFVL